ncbi:hypothetical protein GCM10009574_006150 [Streptomyces asiaticus]|uniref:Uncharacterized protein n=2 Tax=Streptomyces rhizosphaericus TaxID=114699 RepID=A0ABN1RPX5_9ACTN
MNGAEAPDVSQDARGGAIQRYTDGDPCATGTRSTIVTTRRGAPHRSRKAQQPEGAGTETRRNQAARRPNGAGATRPLAGASAPEADSKGFPLSPRSVPGDRRFGTGAP